MIENEKHNNSVTEMENNAEKITKANSAKHVWCQTINNAVHHYQTLLNIALIIEQVSNHEHALRDKVSIKKATCRRQNNVISEENMFNR